MGTPQSPFSVPSPIVSPLCVNLHLQRSFVMSTGWDISMTAPPPKTRGASQRKRPKDDRSQRQWVTARKPCSPNTAGHIHTWTHRGCYSTPKTCTRPSHTKPQHSREEVVTKSHPGWNSTVKRQVSIVWALAGQLNFSERPHIQDTQTAGTVHDRFKQKKTRSWEVGGLIWSKHIEWTAWRTHSKIWNSRPSRRMRAGPYLNSQSLRGSAADVVLELRRRGCIPPFLT